MSEEVKVKRQKVKVKKLKRAVMLLSGGLDSAVALYAAKREGYLVYCLTFDYGQRHRKEINAAKRIAGKSASSWQLVHFELPWKGSSLLDRRAAIPKNRNISAGIPSTYVPARNIIFLSMAASYAESIGAGAIFIGANVIDFSGYPDCRREFLQQYERALRRGTKKGVEGGTIKIIAPLLNKNKAEIVKMAKSLKVPLELTWSCYMGNKHPCGVCDSCRLRERGFKAARIKDPTQ